MCFCKNPLCVIDCGHGLMVDKIIGDILGHNISETGFFFGCAWFVYRGKRIFVENYS